MTKEFTSLGLMSGTSGDGVDASIIKSNGIDKYEVIQDKYFEYESEIYKEFHSLKDKINKADDLKLFQKELKNLEKKITIFHAKVVNDLIKNKMLICRFSRSNIYHNSNEKISNQRVSKVITTNKNIIYDFRKMI